MKITKEQLSKFILAELENFNRHTGRPQTEKGRQMAPEKAFLDKKEKQELDRLIALYGSYTNVPKKFKAHFKENKVKVIENKNPPHPLVDQANQKLHEAYEAVDILTDALEGADADDIAAFHSGAPTISDVGYKIENLYRLLEYLK
jgi:hypothetical protein